MAEEVKKNEIKRIDFSKLKPEELPSKVISVHFETGDQELTIHPLNGRGRIAWIGNPKHTQDHVVFEERAVMLALLYGCDMTEEEADLLMTADYKAARFIGNQVWIYTNEYDKSKKAEAEEAEKNSDTAETVTEN